MRQHDGVLDQRLFPSCNFQPRPLGVIFDIDPIVCCPFDTLEHITSAVQRVRVKFAKLASPLLPLKTPRVKVAVEEDRTALAWPNECGAVAIVRVA